MDRFIEFLLTVFQSCTKDLKSNMDRFIDENNILNIPMTKTFKIQYGQIYSRFRFQSLSNSQYLKSNMDRFIAVLKL